MRYGASYILNISILHKYLIFTFKNTLEDLHNLMLASGSDDYENAADTSYIAKAALKPNTD